MHSMRLAQEAVSAGNDGNISLALKLYTSAAEHEYAALSKIPRDKPRTYGITAVGAVILFSKAGLYSKAKAVACEAIKSDIIPEFAINQLNEALTNIEAAIANSNQRVIKSELIAAIPNLRAFACSLCGSSDYADDIIQVTLIKAYASCDSYVEGTNVTAWLFTILRNIYYSDYRKRRQETPDTGGAIAARLVAPATQNAHMDFLDFRNALQKLAPDQREVLILIGASGLSYEEAAAICNCTPDTMKSRVNRARARLSELLQLGSNDLSDTLQQHLKKKYDFLKALK
jgi:RNA polymerase sigma-70 factor, ECF subfamily